MNRHDARSASLRDRDFRSPRCDTRCSLLLRCFPRDGEIDVHHAGAIRFFDVAAQHREAAEGVLLFHLEQDGVAGINRTAKTHVADLRDQRHAFTRLARRPLAPSAPCSTRAGLKHRFAQQHAGSDRRAGIVALVEILVGAPGAFRGQSVGGFADDLVDKQEWRTMRNQVGDFGIGK